MPAPRTLLGSLSCAALALACLLGGACSSGGDGGASEADAHVAGDGSTSGDTDVPLVDDAVDVVAPSGTELVPLGSEGLFALERDGQRLLTFGWDGLALGTVPALDDTLNYDPWYLEPVAADDALYAPPEGLAWIGATAMEDLGESDAGRTLRVTWDDGRSSDLSIDTAAEGRVALRWSPPAEGTPTAYFRLRPRVAGGASEGFYGLGEYFDHVEHRGQTRAMHFEPSPLESAYNEAHFPVPLLVGTSGWGLFVASYRPGVFAVATEQDDLVQVTFGQGADAPEGLEFHLFSSAHPLDVTRHYYDVTGYPGPFAPWALGPWIWRDEVDGQAAVEADLLTIRDLDLATTGYWIDRPYATSVNTFDLNPATYGDPAAMMNVADSLGFAMALWHTPYVDPDHEASAPLYEEAASAGYFAPLMATAFGPWGPPLDLSNAAAFSWWQEQLQPYVDLGIVGYKLDYAEEVIVGAFGTRLPWAFADGTDELTMQRRYQLLYHQVYAELLPEDGGFLLCRAGGWGDQVNGTIVWPGDIDANMARHGDKVTEEDGSWYVAVGGLPAAVVAGSSLGPSGFPLFGSDTGGYRHSPPDEETYIRWIQHTALSPVMQVGTNTNDLPWSFGDAEVHDPELVDLYRLYARLHLRLWPYLWTQVAALATTGRAIQRPLGLAHPELGVHPDDVYLLGDDLLVGPVVDPGVTSRTLPLPAGTWIDWWTGAAHVGPEAEIEAPLDRIPLLLRAGHPVPLLRPTIDTLRPVTDPDAVDSFATAAGPLHVVVAPGPEGSFTLYDGTVVAQAPVEGGLELSWTPGAVFAGGVTIFEVLAVGAEPSAVEGATSWSWDPARGGTITVEVDAVAPTRITVP